MSNVIVEDGVQYQSLIDFMTEFNIIDDFSKEDIEKLNQELHQYCIENNINYKEIPNFPNFETVH